MRLSELYGTSLALLTDLYQLTMAYGYWKTGIADRPSVFQMSFRKKPFANGYAVFAGLQFVIDYINQLQFSTSDLEYLSSLTGNDGKPLFDAEFLGFLEQLEFCCDVDAVVEGSIVFPHEPLIRVKGPILQCQLIESALLNMVNFQTLVATKSARICIAAGEQPVIEFGLRRAQGIDGSLAASRAAYIGGCSATSNVLAGKLFGIPTKGTHAHSWVMAFKDEQTAFECYADSLPGNCIFLVDTFDTEDGVMHAIEAGKKLRTKGHEMVGIRLDSGDLAYLSSQARKLLDAAGFEKAIIVASNDLDETVINSLKNQDARIDVWGIGTKLVTGNPDAALGGVYKLSAIMDDSGRWKPKIKLSEQNIKISTPGSLQVRRFYEDGIAVADMIFELDQPDESSDNQTIVDPLDATRMRKINNDFEHEDLLQPVFQAGKQIYEIPALADSRSYCQQQLNLFHQSIRRHENPHEYPVGLEKSLHDKKTRLILAARGVDQESPA